MVKIINFILITTLILHCSCKTKVIKPLYILKNDVSIYPDENSKDILKIKNEMDILYLVSEKISKSGRIKIKDETGTTGWIDEKYTSYISIDWEKKDIAENLYVYMPPDYKITFQENIYNKSDNLLELYSEINDVEIHIYIVTTKKQLEKFIYDEITIGKSKDYNHSKWILQDKIFYSRTTHNEDSRLVEGIDFIRDNYKNKRYGFWIYYDPSIAENNLLLAKKIMFSILKSIQ